MTQVSIRVSTGTRDALSVLRENLGYESLDGLLEDMAEFLDPEENPKNFDAFDEAFPGDEDEEDEEEESEE
jgi:hypothetical protein